MGGRVKLNHMTDRPFNNEFLLRPLIRNTLHPNSRANLFMQYIDALFRENKERIPVLIQSCSLKTWEGISWITRPRFVPLHSQMDRTSKIFGENRGRGASTRVLIFTDEPVNFVSPQCDIT